MKKIIIQITLSESELSQFMTTGELNINHETAQLPALFVDRDITGGEVMKLLNCTCVDLNYYRASGKLPSSKIKPKTYRYKLSEVLRFKEAHTAKEEGGLF